MYCVWQQRCHHTGLHAAGRPYVFSWHYSNAGASQYNPASESPNPSQPKYTPSQSPERASDPLAFILNPPVAQSQPPQRSAAVASGRKAIKAAYQPYQPPSDSLQWLAPQQQPKVQPCSLLLPAGIIAKPNRPGWHVSSRCSLT